MYIDLCIVGNIEEKEIIYRLISLLTYITLKRNR